MSRMSKKEIKELMKLKDWSPSKLASELNLSEHAVYKWLNGDRIPSGPASILMEMWLTDARIQ